jgi:multiple sugar transport system permease protein
MYEEGFRWWNLGYGAAVAFALFAVILAVTLLQLTWRDRKLTGGSDMAEAARGDRR